MAVNSPIKIEDLTDEQITMIVRRIETFAKSNEFFAKFTNPVKRQHGEKTWRSRKVVRPLVKPEDIREAVEDVAPRPQKIAVQTFEHSLTNYRDKVTYTAEDVLYGYDDIVKIAGDTLGEITVQKLDILKGTPFINSKCSATFVDNYDKTLAKVAIILQKNKAKAWSNGRYLAIVTPETLEEIRQSLKSTSNGILSDATKEEYDSGIIAHYGRWNFAVCDSDLLYKGEGKQWMVCLGRRPTGESPIDVATMDGVKVYHNPLGSGVLLDEDGNITSDDNKQRGSVACNIDGLGAYVNDDLCVIDVEVSASKIGSLFGQDEFDYEETFPTGYVSGSESPVE